MSKELLMFGYGTLSAFTFLVVVSKIARGEDPVAYVALGLALYSRAKDIYRDIEEEVRRATWSQR